MRDPKTEQYLTNGGWKWEYVERVEFREIDVAASKENPSRLLRRVNDDVALGYGLAMKAGDQFPAIVLTVILPSSDEPDPENGISLIITQAQKAALKKLGRTDEQIRTMTPADAHQLLGLTESKPRSPAFKYEIATGVHRVVGAECADIKHFDAYIITEPDAYRLETLVRQLNTIEGQGVSPRDRVLQVLLLNAAYPSHSLRQLAKEWRLPYSTVKSAFMEKQASRRAQKFGFDLSNLGKGSKVSQTSLLALNSIHSDPVFEKALHFAVNTGAKAVELEEMVQEIKATRDEGSALKVVERHNADAAQVKIMAEAKHGRTSPAAATKFVGDAKRLNNQLNRGVEQLYFAAYPRLDHARIVIDDLIDNLKRVSNEVRRLERVGEMARTSIATSDDSRAGLH
jgi:hypothetical protein